MSIVRKRNYFYVDQNSLNDENLSWEAKGLWNYIINLPDEHDIKFEDLKGISRDDDNSIRSILKELHEKKYIELQDEA